jgi:UTP--glucose-1-phosphate uridylyltransferase
MAHTRSVTKAVIPAAGLGTRFVPATKAMPKEMLPVIDTPVIQYVVEEAGAAGLTDVLMITARSKTNIEDHFDRNIELEEVLAARGDTAGLQRVRESAEIATMHYVRQSQPLGLGHAVLCAADHVGDEPFAVLLGDDIIDARDRLLQRMLEVRHHYGGSVIALMEVEPAQVSAYGVATIKPTGEADVVAVTDLVEKPAVAEAPSNWIVVGRYVCDPSVFDVLRKTRAGRGGEIQLTDALRTLAERGPDTDGGGVHGVLFRGRRYDTGNKLDYLQTQVKFACERPDVKDEFVPWLRGYLDELERGRGTQAAVAHGQRGEAVP